MLDVSTLAVILLIEGPGDVSSAAVFDDVAAALAWRPSLKLVQDTVSPFARCGGDEACLGAELAELRIALGLVVLVNTDVSPGLVSIRAIEAESGAIRARRSGALEGESRALIARLVTEVLDELGHREAAQIAIEGELNGLEIDPPPLAGSGALYWVAPGRTRIKAEGAVAVEIEARAAEKMNVLLAREPAPVVESPWLWLGLSVAIVGAAVAAGVIASRNDGDLCICLGRPSDSCPEC